MSLFSDTVPGSILAADPVNVVIQTSLTDRLTAWGTVAAVSVALLLGLIEIGRSRRANARLEPSKVTAWVHVGPNATNTGTDWTLKVSNNSNQLIRSVRYMNLVLSHPVFDSIAPGGYREMVINADNEKVDEDRAVEFSFVCQGRTWLRLPNGRLQHTFGRAKGSVDFTGLPRVQELVGFKARFRESLLKLRGLFQSA